MGTRRTQATPSVLNVAEFKARALAILRGVHETGEPVEITSRGRPLARIEPLRDEAEPKGYGCMKGRFELLAPESESSPVGSKAWGTLREWREERSKR